MTDVWTWRYNMFPYLSFIRLLRMAYITRKSSDIFRRSHQDKGPFHTDTVRCFFWFDSYPVCMLITLQFFDQVLQCKGRNTSQELLVRRTESTCTPHLHVEHFSGTKITPTAETSSDLILIVDKKNQLDVNFCILYFSSNSCSTCFGQPCAHHQELTTAWCYSLVLVCAVAAGRWSSPVGR